MSKILEDINNKRKFLFFEVPKFDECMTSWITRNGLCNYMDFSEYLKKCGLLYNLNYDFDLNFKQFFNTIVSHNFSYSAYNDFERNHLNFIQIASVKEYKTIIIPSTTYKKAVQYPLQYCPKCLNSNKPYYSLFWRISLFYGCLKCKCYLLSGCLKCKYPLQFTKIQADFIYNNKQILKCYSCNYPLNSFSSKTLDIDDYEILLWLTNCFFENGAALEKIISMINLIISNTKVSCCIRKYFKLEQTSGHFSTLSPEERSLILKSVFFWFNNQFNTINSINRKNNLTMKNWPNEFIIF